MNICLVEDNDALREMLVKVLSGEGFGITGVADAEAMDLARPKQHFDAYIIDIELPGEDGLSITQRLKAVDPDAFVVMMTARSGLQDKVVGYEVGADVYLPKPFESAELMAVLRSMDKRLSARHKRGDGPTDFQLLTSRFAICHPQKGVELALTATQWRILKALIEAPNRQLAYWQLLDLLGKPVNTQSKRALEVHMTHLRSKIRQLGGPKFPIQSIRGEGYHLSMDWTVQHG